MPGQCMCAAFVALMTWRHMPAFRQLGHLHERPTGSTTQPPSGMPSHMRRR
ncbi:hypothetical protein PR003_g23477 [Phytophthora rubi]|uniref:Uncharacterized protein n=1 Tax=Phytophthora rubi TaxID=129364 RepID=A0A6A4CVM0_9STRA|nr:hypothetical protein PR003_g23477 [Phytophthora rubi]